MITKPSKCGPVRLFNPQNSHGKRKEMIPTRCPLTQTQNKSLKKEKNINPKMLWKYQSAKSSKKD